MSHIQRRFALLALCAVLAPVGASAQTVPASAKGAYINDQQSATTIGTSSTYQAGDTFNDFTTTFRSYFTFAIPSLAPGEAFDGATLRIQAPAGSYASPDASETYGLFDFSFNPTALANLASNTGGATAFNDLGTGTSYGGVTLSSANDGTIVEIVLNAAGLADINTRAGQTIGLGGAVTTLGPGVQNQFVFSTSGPTNAVELVLTRTGGSAAAPEPAAAVLAMTGIGLFAARRRKN